MGTDRQLRSRAATVCALVCALPLLAVSCKQPAPPPVASSSAQASTSATVAPSKVSTMPLAEFCSGLRSKLDTLVDSCKPRPETDALFRIAKISADQMAHDYSSCSSLKNVDIVADKVPACLAEVRSHWDADLVHIENRPACRSAFVGKTPVGGKCSSDLECPPSSFCVADPAGGTDTLAQVCSPTTAAGATCIEHRGTACNPDFHCVAGKCEKAPGEGEACSAASQICASGLTCLIDKSTDTQGKCGPRRKAGAACHRWTECAGACVTPAGSKDGQCESFCGSE